MGWPPQPKPRRRSQREAQVAVCFAGCQKEAEGFAFQGATEAVRFPREEEEVAVGVAKGQRKEKQETQEGQEGRGEEGGVASSRGLALRGLLGEVLGSGGRDEATRPRCGGHGRRRRREEEGPELAGGAHGRGAEGGPGEGGEGAKGAGGERARAAGPRAEVARGDRAKSQREAREGRAREKRENREGEEGEGGAGEARARGERG